MHIFQKEDPDHLNQYVVHPANPDNFTQDHVNFLKSWFTSPDGINGMLANLCQDENNTISPWIKDSRIRFLLEYGEENKDIFFHPDNRGWGIGYYDCYYTDSNGDDVHSNSAAYSYSVKNRYVTGGNSGWAPFLPQDYIDFMSQNENRNAFHVFLTRGTWIDVNADGVPACKRGGVSVLSQDGQTNTFH